MLAGVAPYRAAMHWPRDRAPLGRKPRVSAHSCDGRFCNPILVVKLHPFLSPSSSFFGKRESETTVLSA